MCVLGDLSLHLLPLEAIDTDSPQTPLMSTTKAKCSSSTNMTHQITKKDMIEMNSTASGIKGVLDNLRMQLQILDAEIKADEKSKAEFERHLGLLETRKTDILTRMRGNEEWSKQYDSDIGPFANR